MLRQSLEWLVRVSLAKKLGRVFGQREQHGQSPEACHTTAQSVQVGLEQFRLTRGDVEQWERDRRALGLECCAGVATLHCPLDPSAPQVLAAGIEANIPVTYGIGSQRGDKSTGCQFIGQSPVHSVSAAC